MAMIPPVPSADVPIPGESGTIVTLELLADDVLAEGTVVNASIEDISFRTWYADRSGEDANLQSSVNFKITIGAPADSSMVLDEDGTELPTAQSGAEERVKRTIQADLWSTICLPFAMTAEQVKTAFGDDVQIADFTSWSSEEDGDAIVKLIMNFTSVNAIEANHPYVIKTAQTITEFTLDNVDVDPEDEPMVQVGKKASERGSMYGTYVVTMVPEENLFLSDNTYCYSDGTVRTKGLRAYFELRDVLDAYYGDSTADLSAYITMTVDGNEVPNGVSQILHSIYADDKVYDLKGRRVVTPGKGIYIMNGRKIYK